MGGRHAPHRRRSRRSGPAGWRVTVVDPIAEPEAFPAAERVHRGDGPRAGVDRASTPYVVVATQGIWDEEARLGPATRGGLRRSRRLADAASGRARVAARREAVPDRSVSRPCARRRAWTSAPRRPPRSRSRSWPSWSRCAAAGPRSWPRPVPPRSPAPGVESRGGAAPGGRRHRAARSRLWHDRRASHARHLAEHDGIVYAFCAIGCRTRLHPRSDRLSAASIPRRRTGADRVGRPGAAGSRPGGRMQFEGTVPIRAPREGLGVRHRPEQVGPVRPGRRVDRGRRRRATSRPTAKVGVGFISARRSTST